MILLLLSYVSVKSIKVGDLIKFYYSLYLFGMSLANTSMFHVIFYIYIIMSPPDFLRLFLVFRFLWLISMTRLPYFDTQTPPT